MYVAQRGFDYGISMHYGRKPCPAFHSAACAYLTDPLSPRRLYQIDPSTTLSTNYSPPNLHRRCLRLIAPYSVRPPRMYVAQRGFDHGISMHYGRKPCPAFHSAACAYLTDPLSPRRLYQIDPLTTLSTNHSPPNRHRRCRHHR